MYSPSEKSFLETASLLQRKEFAQFLTPAAIAAPMVQWATYSYRTTSFLDPGVGTAVFSKELIDNRRRKEIKTPLLVHCVDIDQQVMDFAKKGIINQPTEDVAFFLQDFLQFEPGRLYQSVVSNPPYYKHHFIENKADVVADIERLTGYALPVTTNIYCLFMFRARALMDTPGRCAFIIPSEFLNADYGKQVKAHLIKDPAFRGMIVFNFTTLVFDALTTACIVLFDTGKHRSDGVKFVSLDDPNSVDAAFDVFDPKKKDGLFEGVSLPVYSYARADLDPSRKWKNYLASSQPQSAYVDLVPLKKYASCRRGIATGANDYFTFSESRRRELGISKRDVSFCLTKSADVPTYIFDTDDLNNLIKQDAKIYLLNPKPPLSETVRNYLAYGESEKVHERYLPAHRDVWYLPENQKPADIWVMVFSRERTRFVWNQAGINHLTTFHGIYPSDLIGKRYIAPLLLYLWSDACQHVMAEQQRQYGNGLKKYEPRDIERMLVPDFDKGQESWLEEADTILRKIETAHRENAPVNGTHDEIESFLARTWLQRK